MRAVLADPLAERRLQELERLARARVAALLTTRRKGVVTVRIEIEGAQISWHSGVAVEERPLDRGEG